MTKISVAMSGGGHRASLFGLGVLLYLHDAAKHGDVASISSVSGGSITNGVVAQAGNYRTMAPNEFKDVAESLARQIAQRGTLWAAWVTWLYLAATVIALLGAVALLWLPLATPWRWALFAVALIVWWQLLVGRRSAVCGRAFASVLFSPQGKKTLLNEVGEDDIDYVICSTELHAGEHVYFSGKFVCSYRLGWGEPGNLRLDQAVQASAAFPGGFPCRWYRTSRHNFTQGTESARVMALQDGGVYDNMGEQWALGMRARRARWQDHASEFQDADELIVVDASAGMNWTTVGLLGIPILGELFTLLRVLNVMYDNTTAPRRRMLIEQFDAAANSGVGLRGAMINIEQSPHKVPKYFAQAATQWPDRAKRAQAVLASLGGASSDHWKQTAAKNAAVGTTLKRLGPAVSASLLHHAYVLAMSNLHVLLDYPLLKIPPLSDFEKLVS